MKILMVVNWYTPKKESIYQAGVFHYEQSIALNSYTETRLYLPFEPNVTDLVGEVERGLYTYRSPGDSSLGKVRWLKKSLGYLKRIIDEFQPDIVHANVAYPAGFLCVLVGRIKKCPIVLTEHAPIEQMYLDNRFRRQMRHWVYKNCKRNICVSNDSKERLKQVFPDIRYEINYNAVINPRKIARDGKTYKVENKINCAIVAAFYDREIKGYQFLLPAVQKLKNDGTDLCLHICGGGEYLNYYIKIAEELGIAQNCIFYGQCSREKVYSIVDQMDFCVSASVFECSGVSVQEELLIGKPVLVTRSGGANSLVTNDCAIVVDRNSVDALADGLKEMSAKYKLFNEKYIIDYAYENFEIENVTRRYLNIYEEVLSEQ